MSAKPETRIFLTFDFEDNFMDLDRLAQDFNDKVHSVKLGQGFLLDERAHKITKRLLAHGTTLYLDAKYIDDPDQMASQVRTVASMGFSYVSVSPSAGRESLIAAGRAQEGIKVVAAFSADVEMNRIETRKVRGANRKLDDEHKIEIGMCNVLCIERIKSLGNFSVIATGIRMPEDDRNDQPSVMTPAQALSLGADYLAIGRAITAHSDRHDAFDRILENIASVG